MTKSKPNRVWTENAMEEEGLGTHCPKIHIWGAISSRGALSLEIFDHDLNSQHYLKILKKK